MAEEQILKNYQRLCTELTIDIQKNKDLKLGNSMKNLKSYTHYPDSAVNSTFTVIKCKY